jgi:hypothetical protein
MQFTLNLTPPPPPPTHPHAYVVNTSTMHIFLPRAEVRFPTLSTPSVSFYLSIDSVKLHYPATNKKTEGVVINKKTVIFLNLAQKGSQIWPPE